MEQSNGQALIADALKRSVTQRVITGRRRDASEIDKPIRFSTSTLPAHELKSEVTYTMPNISPVALAICEVNAAMFGWRIASYVWVANRLLLFLHAQ
jgi:hypothetical protein